MGFATADDAAVYRLTARLAVVDTVDFFPPVVDDPFAYGQIAAANALSDIWAMGARPLFALNLVAFPTQALPLETLARILAGGQSKADEAGIPILGGHSVRRPRAQVRHGGHRAWCTRRRILTNAGGRPGDVLLLTKPHRLGHRNHRDQAGNRTPELEASVVELMSSLNRAAGEVFASGKFPVNALTDVTGFGLLGHLAEMALGAKVRARLFLERVPIIAGVPALAEQGVVPGGTKANLAHVGSARALPRGSARRRCGGCSPMRRRTAGSSPRCLPGMPVRRSPPWTRRG